MSPLAALALRTLLVLSPLEQPRETLPGWHETAWQRGVRYLSIASAVAGAVEDACGDRGEGCRRWSLAVLMGIGWHESGWSPDVEAPSGCYRGKGHLQRCDGGRAASSWQLQGSAEERAMWLASRRAAAREALRRARRSWNACRKLPAEERWTAYAGGTCSGDVARRRSRELHAAVTRALAVR